MEWWKKSRIRAGDNMEESMGERSECRREEGR